MLDKKKQHIFGVVFVLIVGILLHIFLNADFFDSGIIAFGALLMINKIYSVIYEGKE